MQKQGYTVFSGPRKNAPKGDKAVKNAFKEGEEIITVQKLEHYNKHTIDGKTIAKIMNDEQDHKPPQMPQDLRIAISQARNQKGLTQEQFAHMLNIPKSSVNSWENGKVRPTGNQIVKMEKILKVKLPRPPK